MGLLVAVDIWLSALRGHMLCLFQLDATAALHAAMRCAGRTPIMNAIAAEIALRLESASVRVIPEHLSGTFNFQCDAFSRLAIGAHIPSCLS